MFSILLPQECHSASASTCSHVYHTGTTVQETMIWFSPKCPQNSYGYRFRGSFDTVKYSLQLSSVFLYSKNAISWTVASVWYIENVQFLVHPVQLHCYLQIIPFIWILMVKDYCRHDGQRNILNNNNNRLMALCPGLPEPVPEETLTHPPSWSSSNLYQLLLSTTIHSILLVQITCLAIFLHNLFSCLLYLRLKYVKVIWILASESRDKVACLLAQFIW